MEELSLLNEIQVDKLGKHLGILLGIQDYGYSCLKIEVAVVRTRDESIDRLENSLETIHWVAYENRSFWKKLGGKAENLNGKTRMKAWYWISDLEI